jgi:hypothetical protein
MLYDLANLNSLMEHYDQLGLIKGNKKLEDLYVQTQRASTMISHFDSTFSQSFKMPAGVIVLENTKQKALIKNTAMSFFDKIAVFFVTKFAHVSKGIGDENKVSHIQPHYKREELTYREYLYSDMYQIKIENLIDEKNKKLLKEKLGDDWPRQLQEKFAKIERDIHEKSIEDKDKDFVHSVGCDGTTQRYAKLATTKLQGGHKNLFQADHKNKDIRDEVFRKDHWVNAGGQIVTNLICSEFVGKTIIAAVQELNDVVVQQLKEKGVENPPDLLIKSPISEKEKLHLLTPERLLVAMQERGAVEQLEVSPELNKFVSKGEQTIKDKSTPPQKETKQVQSATPTSDEPDESFRPQGM